MIIILIVIITVLAVEAVIIIPDKIPFLRKKKK